MGGTRKQKVKNRTRTIHNAITITFIALYPFLSYLSIKNFGIKIASLIILLLLFGSAAVKIMLTKSLIPHIIFQVVSVGGILLTGYLLENDFFMKVVPALIALSASINFLMSLKKHLSSSQSQEFKNQTLQNKRWPIQEK